MKAPSVVTIEPSPVLTYLGDANEKPTPVGTLAQGVPAPMGRAIARAVKQAIAERVA